MAGYDAARRSHFHRSSETAALAADLGRALAEEHRWKDEVAAGLAVLVLLANDPETEVSEHGVTGVPLSGSRAGVANSKRLRSYYHEITHENEKTAAQEHGERMSRRVRYGRAREKAGQKYDNRLAAEMREWLKSTVLEDPAEQVAAEAEQAAAEAAVEHWLDQLTLAQRQALEDELNGKPTNGAADRQNRSRARRRLREAMSQNVRVRRLVIEG